MARRTATLYIRIIKNGKSSFCKPVYQSKGRLKPLSAMVNGEQEHHKEGIYYLRFGSDGGKQSFVPVGKDPYVALDKLEEKKRVGIPGTGGDIDYGADSVWLTVFDVPLTRVDATTNRVVKQWIGKGGDSLRFGFGSLWITDYKKGLLSRIPIEQLR